MAKGPTVRQTQVDILHRIHTEGVVVAYETALSVARDEKSPANARASIARTLFQAAGYLDRGNSGPLDKEPHEMTPEELNSAVAKTIAGFQQPATQDDDAPGGIFG